MKKLLAVLLVLIMCMSLVLTSCAKKNEVILEEPANKPSDGTTDDTPADDTGLSAEELVIANLVSSVSLEGLFDLDTWLGQGTIEIPEMDIEQIMSQVMAVGKEMIVYEGDNRVGYLGIKDGIIKITSYEDGPETYMRFESNGNITMFTVNADGTYVVDKVISLIPDIGGVSEIPDMETIMGMINQYIPQEVIDAIEGIKLPAVAAGDLEKVDGYYVFKEAYYGKLVDKAIGLYTEISGALGTNGTDEELTEMSDMLKKVIDVLNLKIGFAVEGEKITGAIIAADANIGELKSLISGDGSDASEYSQKFAFKFTVGSNGMELDAHMTVADTEMVGVNFTVSAVDEDTRKGLECNLSANIAGEELSANAVAVVKFNGGMMNGFELSAETDLGTYGGENNISLVCGVDVASKTIKTTFSMYLDDGYGYGEYIDEGGKEVYVTGYGSLTVNAEMSISIDEAMSAGSKVVDLKVNINGVCDTFTTINEETGTVDTISVSEENLDIFKLDVLVEESCIIGANGSATVYVDVTYNKVDKQSFRVEIRDVTEEYGKVPECVKELDLTPNDFERLEMIGNKMVDMIIWDEDDEYSGVYIYLDEETGLKVFASAFNYDGEIIITNADYENYQDVYLECKYITSSDLL